jgi:threonine synthase
MKYYSTNHPGHRATFKEAVLHGLAPDLGLYMPEFIPALTKDFFDRLPAMSFAEHAFEVANAFLKDDLPEVELRSIIDRAVAANAPLVALTSKIYALELFHGPTLAFKDFGATFLAGLLSYFARQISQEVLVLTATSGDTGGAVANGFLGVAGTRVVVLYPSGKVSDLQERQFTTLGQNITAIEVAGTFDDCQRLVKLAFADTTLKQRYCLTSANSINIARLLPQMFYYFHAWAQLRPRQPVCISVPSGNFGNLTAGLLAKKMGLPVAKFVAATNRNDSVPTYLRTGVFTPHTSHTTISNAMDVGNPSNFQRIVRLYPSVDQLRQDVVGFACSDDETSLVMKRVFDEHGYLLDPHGAVGYLGLQNYLGTHPDHLSIFLHTAHPAKFRDVVESVVSQTIEVPERLRKILHRSKKTIATGASWDSVREAIVR